LVAFDKTFLNLALEAKVDKDCNVYDDNLMIFTGKSCIQTTERSGEH